MINLEELLVKNISKETDPQNIYPNNEIIKEFENFGEKINAVNLCIICENSLLFIKRSETMPSYGGHVAFLGGHIEKGESFLEAALREFNEEVSLSSEVLEHLGFLRIVLAKNFKPILPVVFRLKISKDEFLEKAKSNGEWVDIFWVDVEQLLTEERWRIENREYKGLQMKVHYYDLLQSDRHSQLNNSSEYLLWGATGRIVYKLMKLLKKLS